MTASSKAAGRALATLDTRSAFGARTPDTAAREAWRLATDSSLPTEIRKANRKRIPAGQRGPFDVTVEGIRFRAYPAENRCDRILVGRGKLPEGPEHELLAPFLHTGAVFVDIGANIGTYALWAAKRVAPGGLVIALEPHPRTFAKLEFNRAANGAENVRCLNVAAGPEAGTAVLRFDGGGNVGGASLLGGETAASGAEVPVSVRPLAEILAELGVGGVDVLKVDVEGYEDRALLPYFDNAPRALWPRTIMIETVLQDRWERDCMSELSGHGYEHLAATAENVILGRRK
ncbi:MAG: FkbM family methyltransferase [Rhizobiaceae bacterium]